MVFPKKSEVLEYNDICVSWRPGDEFFKLGSFILGSKKVAFPVKHLTWRFTQK